MPDPTQILSIEEPWIKATIITPDEYLGSIIKICQDKRGIQTNLNLFWKSGCVKLRITFKRSSL